MRVRVYVEANEVLREVAEIEVLDDADDPESCAWRTFSRRSNLPATNFSVSIAGKRFRVSEQLTTTWQPLRHA